MPDPFAPPPAPAVPAQRPPKCGHRRDDTITSYRCDLYRTHEGQHHQIGTPVYWDQENS